MVFLGILKKELRSLGILIAKMLQGECIVVNNYKLLSQTAEKRGKESSFEKKKVS